MGCNVYYRRRARGSSQLYSGSLYYSQRPRRLYLCFTLCIVFSIKAPNSDCTFTQLPAAHEGGSSLSPTELHLQLTTSASQVAKCSFGCFSSCSFCCVFGFSESFSGNLYDRLIMMTYSSLEMINAWMLSFATIHQTHLKLFSDQTLDFWQLASTVVTCELGILILAVLHKSCDSFEAF